MTDVFLEHANGEHIGDLIRVSKREILVGRLSDCDIITEPVFTSVSQHHAILRKTSNGWVIVDIGTHSKGSSYGTYINNVRSEPNKEVLLHPKDEIRLGTKLGKYFRFHGEGTAPVSQSINLKNRFSIDIRKRLVLVDGRTISLSLTPQEFDFLFILWQKSDSICLFKDICTRMWPQEKIISQHTIDADLRVRINTLAHGTRRKLKIALDGLDILESCRGIGYRLRL